MSARQRPPAVFGAKAVSNRNQAVISVVYDKIAHPENNARFYLLQCNMTVSICKMESSLKIAIVDENPLRTAVLLEGLRDAGLRNTTHIADMTDLLSKVTALDPNVILIDLENPSRDVLEQMFQMSRAVKRPVAMFVDRSDEDSIKAAVDAGISAYVVDGLKKERVKHIIDISVSRFRAFSQIKDELERTKTALEERKLIDRAKGLLMRAKNLSEEEAYGLMRKTAMNEKRRIADIAQSLVTAAEMFK